MSCLDLSTWACAKRPSDEALKGRYCKLEPFNALLHIRPLFECLQVNNPADSWTYLPYGPFADFSAFEAWITDDQLHKEAFIYTIIDEQERAVGLCAYARIRPEDGSIEIAHIHFSPLMKRQRAATEAIYLLLLNAFKLGNRRAEWKCDTNNKASESAALRFGFVFEGIFRNDRVIKNRNRDTAWFSITDREWPPLRLRFEQWLDPSNFDQSGSQLTRLGAF